MYSPCLNGSIRGSIWIVLFLLAAETGEAGEPLFALISWGTDPTMPDELPLTLGSSRYSSLFCLLRRRNQNKRAPARTSKPPTTPTTMPTMPPVPSPDFLDEAPFWSPLGSVCVGDLPLPSVTCPDDDELAGVVEVEDVESVDDCKTS